MKNMYGGAVWESGEGDRDNIMKGLYGTLNLVFILKLVKTCP